MSLEDLSEIGIKKIGHRIEILKQTNIAVIKRLEETFYESDLRTEIDDDLKTEDLDMRTEDLQTEVVLKKIFEEESMKGLFSDQERKEIENKRKTYNSKVVSKTQPETEKRSKTIIIVPKTKMEIKINNKNEEKNQSWNEPETILTENYTSDEDKTELTNLFKNDSELANMFSKEEIEEMRKKSKIEKPEKKKKSKSLHEDNNNILSIKETKITRKRSNSDEFKFHLENENKIDDQLNEELIDEKNEKG
jgi:hypothetical protein